MVVHVERTAYKATAVNIDYDRMGLRGVGQIEPQRNRPRRSGDGYGPNLQISLDRGHRGKAIAAHQLQRRRKRHSLQIRLGLRIDSSQELNDFWIHVYLYPQLTSIHSCRNPP